MSEPAGQRVVLITGAAGGIGAATVRVFHEAGWAVAGLDRRELPADSHADLELHLDVADADAPRGVVEQVGERFGRLDAVVNNAAVQVVKPTLDTTPQDWDRVMDANLRGVFLMVQAAHPLLKQTRGAIVNVSSVHAMATSPGLAAYAASKGALLALTRVFALEFGDDGIRCNAVLPGAVDTPMLHAGLARAADPPLIPDVDDDRHMDRLDELIRGLGSRHVIGRVGRPEEIGKVIRFLADSELSSFVTGQSIIVDGGATARLSTE